MVGAFHSSDYDNSRGLCITDAGDVCFNVKTWQSENFRGSKGPREQFSGALREFPTAFNVAEFPLEANAINYITERYFSFLL